MSSAFELAGFVVECLVGSGRTGEVWRARDSHGELVALKRLQRRDATMRERLRREAAVLSSVRGDHVVGLRDVVLTETEVVLVTDFLTGGNLAAVLEQRAQLSAPEIVTLVGPLAITLADAHDRGLVHGGITPTNVLFTDDGRPLLGDFGLARLTGVSPPGQPPTPPDDVLALCTIAAGALPVDSAPAGLRAAIDAGLAPTPHNRPPARALAVEVLRSCAAAPVRLNRPPALVTSPPLETLPPQPVPPQPPAPPPPERPVAVPAAALRPTRHKADARPLGRLLRPVVGAALALALVAAAVVGGAAWGRHTRPSAAQLPTPPAVPGAGSRPEQPDAWRDVVTRLGRRRAAAFASGDEQLMRSVYVTGSPPLDADLAALRALTRAGLAVRGFVIATGSVRLLRSSSSSVELRVSDALSGYVLVDAHGRVIRRVAPRPPRTFTLWLARDDGEWRIARLSR